MLRKLVQGRFIYLLASMVMLLILYPYPRAGRLGDLIVTLLFVLIPVTGIYACAGSHRQVIIAWVLGLPAIIAAINQHMGIHVLPGQLGGISTVLFYGYATVIVLATVVRSRRITANTIYGAVSVYLLLGFVFAGLYALVYQGNAQAISFGENIDGVVDYRDFLYFSFVTLTTLGYGDILPLTHAARSLSILEAVSGVVFMATTIARLVGIHASTSSPAE